MRRVWGALYETEDTDAVPEWVRNPAGFRLERARRLAAVASALTTRLPTAAFLYLAGEGTPGIARFLTDRAWRTREREPGADFPPASSTARAFAAYLEHGWPAHRPAWQWELASADTDLAYRPPLPSSAALAAGLRPAPGTRLRVSPYDTDDYGRRTAVKKSGNCPGNWCCRPYAPSSGPRRSWSPAAARAPDAPWSCTTTRPPPWPGSPTDRASHGSRAGHRTRSCCTA
ncbi:hypothetical protein GCM10020000_72660 [Streptomyces olivoverticillatus]